MEYLFLFIIWTFSGVFLTVLSYLINDKNCNLTLRDIIYGSLLGFCMIAVFIFIIMLRLVEWIDTAETITVIKKRK